MPRPQSPPHRTGCRAPRASAGRTSSTSRGRSRWRCRAKTATYSCTARHNIQAKSSTPSHAHSALRTRMWWWNVAAWAARSAARESQPALIACAAAIATHATGRPVKLRLDRDSDMIITGKRHDFVSHYDVGFDDSTGASRAFASATCHAAGCPQIYRARSMTARCFIATTPTTCRMCTSTLSGAKRTPCRTPPSAALAVRRACSPSNTSSTKSHATLGKDPVDDSADQLSTVRWTRNETPYGQVIEDNILQRSHRQTAGTMRTTQRGAPRWTAFNSGNGDAEARPGA